MSDYINPMQSFQQGLGFGTQLQNLQTQRQQQQLAIQQAQQQLQNQEAMQQLYNKIQTEGATAQDYANLASMLPEDQAKPVREAFNLLTESQQRESLNDSGQIYSALRSGNTQIAVDLMQDMKRAYDNAGDQQGSRVIGDLLSTIQAGDDGARLVESYFGNTLALVPGGMDVIENANKLSEEARTQSLHPGKLREQALAAGKTEAETNKLIIETMKLQNEVRQQLAENNGVIPRDKRVGLQDAYRTQFLKYTDTARNAKTKINKIDSVVDRALANSGKGADIEGVTDLAIINSFQRLIDDGVVRGEDVQLAMDAAGKTEKLWNTFNNWTKGQVLSNETREEYRQVAKLLGQAEQQVIADMANMYMPTIEASGLDPVEIFGEEFAPKVDQVTPELKGFQEFVIRNNPEATMESIGNLTLEELKARYPKGAEYHFGQQATPTVNPTTGNPIRTGSFE